MGKLYACLENAFNHWPVKNAGFHGEPSPPWEDVLAVGGKVGQGISQAAQSFTKFLAPDIFYQSRLGKMLVKGGESEGHVGLKNADLLAKINTNKFVEDHKNILRIADPNWQGAGKAFDPDVSQSLTDYIRGRVKTEDLPESLRPSFGKLKADTLRLMTDNAAFKDLNLTMESDLVKPTVKEIFKADSDFSSGLLTMVPKEIFYRVVDEGAATTVSGADWLKVAMPVLSRKNQYDPVLEAMREAVPKMSEIEAEYTKTLMDRIVGRRTKVQTSVDNMINNVRYAAGAKEVQFSPSAKFATGLTDTFYRSMMLYNPGMALFNASQQLNNLAKFGFKRTMAGLEGFNSKVGKELAAEKLFLGDLDRRFYTANGAQSKFRQGMEKFEHVGYMLFDKMEHWNRGIAFHAGLNRWMEENSIRGLDDFLALRAGSEAQNDLFQKGMLSGLEAANETQFLYGVAHQSPYVSSPLAKLLVGQFTTFPLRQGEFFVKQLRAGDYTFPLRFIGYTGAASAIAYYGMGLAMGKELGGGGSFPEALDFWQQGKPTEAVWTATAGLFRFLPERYSIAQGLTPAGSMLFDALGLMSTEDSDVKWQRIGRSASLLLPAGLEMRRLLEGYMVQATQEGDRFAPRGAAQGFSIPTALSAAAKQVFGEPIPGISPRYTGALQRRETLTDTLAASGGFRTVKAEMESRILDINQGNADEMRTGMVSAADKIAQALLYGKPEEVNAAMQEALSSGAFASPKSLNQSIESAINRQKTTRTEREAKSAPLAERRRR